jgi:8-oxo-dGTP diphosphatase
VPTTGEALSRVLALASAAGKLSKDEVDYRPSEDPARRCGTCDMFSKGTCSLVQGRIDPRDVCDRWEASKIKASLPGASLLVRLGAGFVEGYEREEKGHLERVSGYADNKHAAPKPPRAYVIRMDDGTLIEVDRNRLWLHKSEGKPGPIGHAVPGTMVTWRYSGDTVAGRVVGDTDNLPEGTRFTPRQATFVDSTGARHWGLWGGAGLLLHHTDDAGVARYLLQRRAHGIHQGGTWSTPGGAIDKPGGITEPPATAAFREAEEEGWGNLLKNATITGVQQEHFGGKPGEQGVWTYHTVSASLPAMEQPSGKGSHAGEATGAKWVTPEEMAKLPLHPDFMKTATALGRPGNIPNPSLGGGKWGLEGSPRARHPLVRDDYKAGRKVTWRYKGQPVEGIVQGPAGKPEKDSKRPSHYTVKTANGQNVEVRWGELRLHPSESPKDAEKAKTWEATQHAPKFPGGTSLGKGVKSGYGHPTSPDVIKAHSLALPGLTHTVPAEVNGKKVVGILEHPKQSNLVLRLEDGQGAGFSHGKVQAINQMIGSAGNAAVLQANGWKDIPFSPPQQDQAHSSPLGKVVKAAEDLPPY